MKWKRTLAERLRALGYNSYQDYLRSAHWQDVRRRYYASKLYRSDPGCACCHNPNVPLQLHHKTYKRLGHEYLMDFVAVCDSCHQRSHNLYGLTSRTNLWNSYKRVRRALKHPNGRHAQAMDEKFKRSGHFIITDGKMIYSP